jgi:hypothetical protein
MPGIVSTSAFDHFDALFRDHRGLDTTDVDRATPMGRDGFKKRLPCLALVVIFGTMRAAIVMAMGAAGGAALVGDHTVRGRPGDVEGFQFYPNLLGSVG